ncbi:hypothetical protein [Marinimicrobium agarilyticum]|uniref:hypothetical protein n=1 Tax=Marinimicrobium agarilyticum TaxID=306546 RepID=UPI000420739D|nr:hypothetical protein [Marinimicrobium agarilyticum]
MAEIAVLTGDLINSTRVQQPEAFSRRLKTLLNGLEQDYGAEAGTFRGDGFQVTLERPGEAFEVALRLRAGLIGASPSRSDRWDARISIALGAAKGPEGGFGSAYTDSGRALDQMERETLRFHAERKQLTLALDLVTAFVDDILCQWTPSEAEVYFEHLCRPEGGHSAIASRLNKSRPTVTQALLRARYNLLDRYLRDSRQLMEADYA